MNEKSVLIPYRLGGDRSCVYEEDGKPVRMGGVVNVVTESWFGEIEHSGELIGVSYSQDGFISSISLANGDDRTIDIPCDGTFYRPDKEDLR